MALMDSFPGRSPGARLSEAAEVLGVPERVIIDRALDSYLPQFVRKCGACNGTGVNGKGGTCTMCGGSGIF